MYPLNKYQKKTHASESSVAKTLFNDLNPSEQALFNTQNSLFNKVHKIPVRIPEKTEKKGKRLKNTNKNPTFHRFFLTQLGMLDTENISFINPISTQEIDELITEIDKISEKKLIHFPIFYLSTPKDDENSIMKNIKNYSLQFFDFLNRLGSALNDKTSSFFHLKQYFSIYDTIIYKNFKIFTSVVVSPALMNSEKNPNFALFVKDFNVVVFWNQRLKDPYSKKIPNIVDSGF